MASIELPFGDLNPRTCVVLGGRGFLGRSLVYSLLKLGDWIVRVADFDQSLELDDVKHPHDSLLRDAISSGRASCHHVDLRDYSLLVKAIEGSSVVFYMEATDASKHDYYFCYMMIVQGAKNVISACRECKVRQLIFNSSADVIFDGSHDIWNGDEFLPCQWRFEDTLSDLKAQAEALVLFANNIDGLLTCALRPSNVFGPGDNEFIPLLVKLAKFGWAKFIIGHGENMSDFTYSENVTHAHICAAKALDSQTVTVAGKAFFITNLEPIRFWEFVSIILEGLGYQRPLIKVPAKMVWFLLLVVKWTQEKLGSSNYNHSVASHFYHAASCTRTLNCSAARTHIGYSPVVKLEDGISLTIRSFSHLAKDSSFIMCTNRGGQSKAEKLLGRGKVAEILLWRDEKKTFTCFLIFCLLYYWFLLSGRTFISSAAKLMLLITTMIYGYGILPPKIRSSFTISKSSLSFNISEIAVKDLISHSAYVWNQGVGCIRLLAQGEDWCKFLKVAFCLYILKSYLLQSLTLVIGVALVFAFMTFLIYEQYESEVDGLVSIVLNGVYRLGILLVRTVNASVASYFQTEGNSLD